MMRAFSVMITELASPWKNSFYAWTVMEIDLCRAMEIDCVGSWGLIVSGRELAGGAS